MRNKLHKYLFQGLSYPEFMDWEETLDEHN